jgi:hypothetical protein
MQSVPITTKVASLNPMKYIEKENKENKEKMR